MITFSSMDISQESSNTSMDIGMNIDTPVLIEKLFRRYLVTYYPPLLDIYFYQEPIAQSTASILSPNEESDGEITIEEDDYRIEKVIIALERIQTKRLSNSLGKIREFSSQRQRALNAMIFMDNLLQFNSGYLSLNSGNNRSSNKITKVGKSIMKQAFTKIAEHSKLSLRISNGLRILNRVNRYR